MCCCMSRTHCVRVNEVEVARVRSLVVYDLVDESALWFMVFLL